MCSSCEQRLSGQQDVQLAIMRLRWDVDQCVRWIFKLLKHFHPYNLGQFMIPIGVGLKRTLLNIL